MITKKKELALLKAVGDGANVYNPQAANYLRKRSMQQMVKITENDDTAPSAPYFRAELTQRGRTYVAALTYEVNNG